MKQPRQYQSRIFMRHSPAESERKNANYKHKKAQQVSRARKRVHFRNYLCLFAPTTGGMLLKALRYCLSFTLQQFYNISSD
jgi:hypothetical protein